MSRKRIQIDAEKCVGCGLCAATCQQSAIAMVDGKAKVVRDDYCDGIGNCLPVCPVGAISFSDQDIAEKPAVPANTASSATVGATEHAASPCQGGVPSGCPGSRAASFSPAAQNGDGVPSNASAPTTQGAAVPAPCPAQLRQWPVQIKLVPVQAPYFDGADLLIAADCTAYAYGNFHQEFMRGKITIIGCPKLDMQDYTDKLTEIIAHNNIQSVTVTRMEVPCCGGIERAAVQALKNSGKQLPLCVKTISLQGEILPM